MTSAPAISFRRFLEDKFAKQGRIVMVQLKYDRRIDLSLWDDVMAEAAKPYLLPRYLKGNEDCLREARQSMTRKALGTELAGQFSRYSSESVRTVDKLALEFAESTNRTSEHSAEFARELTRRELREGLSRNESLANLTNRIAKIFRSPKRAVRIAKTEMMRALNAGKFDQAKKLGFVRGKKWRAAPGACDICLALEQKGKTPLDEAFKIDPKGGPYAVTMYPPAHPFCNCSLALVF